MKKGTTFVMTIHTKTTTHFPLGWKHFLVTIPESGGRIDDLANQAFQRICQHEKLTDEDMPFMSESYHYGKDDFEVIDFTNNKSFSQNSK